MSTQRHQVVCSCYSPEHTFTLMMDDDPEWDDVFLYVHLNKQPFWSRLKEAIKYLFGYTSKYGCFDEVCLSQEQLDDLVKFVNKVRDAKSQARNPGVPKEEWLGEPANEVPCCSTQASGLSESSTPKV